MYVWINVCIEPLCWTCSFLSVLTGQRTPQLDMASCTDRRCTGVVSFSPVCSVNQPKSLTCPAAWTALNLRVFGCTALMSTTPVRWKSCVLFRYVCSWYVFVFWLETWTFVRTYIRRWHWPMTPYSTAIFYRPCAQQCRSQYVHTINRRQQYRSVSVYVCVCD